MKSKKMIPRIFSLVLIISLSLNCFDITNRVIANDLQVSADKLNKLNDHITSTLPGYLKVSKLQGIDVTLSESIVIHKWDDNNLNSESYMCFVISNKAIIGKLTISETNGEFSSSFDIGNLEEVNKVFNSNIPVVFGIFNNCLVMQNKSESIILSTLKEKELLVDLPLHKNTKIISEKDKKTFKAAPTTRSTTGSIQLDVLNIYNENINGGICWAASIASKVRFHYNNTLVINGYELHPVDGARTVFNLLNNFYTGNPSGEEPWITRGYNFFGVNVTHTSNMSVSGVYTQLKNKKPVNIGMFNNYFGHSLIISGVDYDPSGGFFTIVDSSSTGLRYSWINPSVINGGNYYSYTHESGIQFNEWRYSWY